MNELQWDIPPKKQIFYLESKLIEGCDISKDCFQRVRNGKWEEIYQTITQNFANKTKVWKNGLHWANTNGYSPKSMEKLLGCFPVDYATWFYMLPEIIPESGMVYLLLDYGDRDWYYGEKFWIFESYIPGLVKALDLLNKSCFLGMGWLDYYIVSKKYKWIIGFNHHHRVSVVGEGLQVDCLK